MPHPTLTPVRRGLDLTNRTECNTMCPTPPATVLANWSHLLGLRRLTRRRSFPRCSIKRSFFPKGRSAIVTAHGFNKKSPKLCVNRRPSSRPAVEAFRKPEVTILPESRGPILVSTCQHNVLPQTTPNGFGVIIGGRGRFGLRREANRKLHFQPISSSSSLA